LPTAVGGESDTKIVQALYLVRGFGSFLFMVV